MPLPLIPLAIGLGVVGGGIKLFKNRRATTGMTPVRRKIYESALKNLKDPAKLRSLSKEFRAQGLNAQADLLDKRAALRELPPDVVQARRGIYRKAMASTNQPEILKVAAAFEKEGATGAAQSLREYAAGLLKNQAAAPAPAPAPAIAGEALESDEGMMGNR